MTSWKKKVFLNIDFKGHTSQYYNDYPFDDLHSMGDDVINIIKRMIGYDELNTVLCEGFTCHVKLYKNSCYVYCKNCYKIMKSEGYKFCKYCKVLSHNCMCYDMYLEDDGYFEDNL